MEENPPPTSPGTIPYMDDYCDPLFYLVDYCLANEFPLFCSLLDSFPRTSVNERSIHCCPDKKFN